MRYEMKTRLLFTRRAGIVVIAIAVFWYVSAEAQSVEKGQSICYELVNDVNLMIDWTETKCTPGAGKGGTLSFVVLSSKPVFSAFKSKKAWVVAVVIALGHTLNKQPSTKVDELVLSDVNQMKSQIIYVLPAALTKSLQSRIYAGQIDPDQTYAEIEKNLVKRKVERPK